MSNIYISVIVAIAALQVVSFYKFISYKKQLDSKNIQVIQFYLDTKFLCKGLIDSLSINDSVIFCRHFMYDVKEYYNLEDIFIIDSLKMLKGENNTVVRSEIVKFLQKHIKRLSNKIYDYKLTKINIDIQDRSYVIYVSRVTEKGEGGDDLIVCVEDSPSLLTKHEKMSLENSVNLLKSRLIYN